MKKTMILAAFAALISLASCQKEDVIDNGTAKKASPVFTASIAGSTKSTVNVSDGKVAWETSDEITITDASSASAVYAIESIDETTGKATFVFKEGAAIATAPYTATYGTEPSTSQTYSATAGKLYMTAATADNSLEFTVQCGLMKINLTKTGESVKRIAVTGIPTGGNETTYTLTCTETQSIASAKDFYIALPAGSYTKIVITDSDDKVCTLTAASALAIAANHIKPVTFGESKLNFVPAPTTGTAMRTGNVEVNWVQLWKGGPKFAEYNVGAANNRAEDYGGYYTWGGTYKNGPGITWKDDRNTDEAILTGETDTATKLWGSNWRMPKQEELQALINPANCTVEWIDGSNKKYNNTTVAGLLCTGEGDYSSNSIFLPAAGDCERGNVLSGYYGYYWSSMPIGNNAEYYLYFDWKSGLDVEGGLRMNWAYSVRAVLVE